jgi:hypothetical protein
MALMATVIFSCKKFIAAVFPAQDVQLQRIQFTVPPVVFADSTKEMQTGSFIVYINADSIIRSKTKGIFGINSVSSVKVKQVTLQCLNADATNNLAAFSSLRMAISMNEEAPPINIISMHIPVTAASTYTEAPQDSPDITAYLHNTSITQTMYVSTRKTTTKALVISVAITLTAK